MSALLRYGPLALAFALSACSRSSEPPPVAEGAEHIDCALNGAPTFEKLCAVDRALQGRVLTLIVRHPDGAFRRFVVLDDGRGLAAADGAEEAVTSYADGVAEVSIGGDRYRFPAKRKDDVRQP